MSQHSGKLLITNGTIVNADRTELNDVYIEDGVIKCIGRNLNVADDIRVINAKDMLIFPGGVDPHTHLDFEFMGTKTADGFYTGTRAAVAGGTTTIIDFAVPKQGESLLETYDKYIEKAKGKAVCDYGFHIGITSWSDTIKKEIKELCENRGINSFKLFMTYDSLMVDDGVLYKVFSECESLGALPMVHAENGHIIAENAKRLLEKGITGPEGHALSRPEHVEAEATNRACVIAHEAGSALYVVHVMSESAASVIAENRNFGHCRIFGETLAAGLALTASNTNDFAIDAAHLMSPPIRSTSTTPLTLMGHLSRNELQTTGSDNCTFNKDQKELGKGDFTKIPNGLNGVEDRLSVVWQKGVELGILNINQFVAVTSTNAAKIFNLYPKKGCIAEGSDADVVVWNPKKSRVISKDTHHQACDFNVFEGMEINGVCEYVIVKGRVCFEDGELYTVKGFGEFLRCPCFSPTVFPKLSEGETEIHTPRSHARVIEFPEPKFVNYKEKQLVLQALKKISGNVNITVLSRFEEMDKENSGLIQRREFQQLLQSLEMLEHLSTREMEAIMRAFNSTPDKQEIRIDYKGFLNGCEYFYRMRK